VGVERGGSGLPLDETERGSLERVSGRSGGSASHS